MTGAVGNCHSKALYDYRLHLVQKYHLLQVHVDEFITSSRSRSFSPISPQVCLYGIHVRRFCITAMKYIFYSKLKTEHKFEECS